MVSRNKFDEGHIQESCYGLRVAGYGLRVTGYGLNSQLATRNSQLVILLTLFLLTAYSLLPTVSFAAISYPDQTGQYISVKLDSSDNPRLSYFDPDTKHLKYTYWDGSQWIRATIDSDGIVGEYSSLALDSADNPRISFYHQIDSDNKAVGALKYAFCDGLCSGSVQWTIVTVDQAPGGRVGGYSSLALDAANMPRIAYYDFKNGELKFAYCDAGCGVSSNWTIVTVDTNGGKHLSLALGPSGEAMISYYDSGNGVMYASSTDLTNWTTRTIDSPSPAGCCNTSITADPATGNPRITYQLDESSDPLSYALYYASCSSNCATTGTWTTVRIDYEQGYPWWYGQFIGTGYYSSLTLSPAPSYLPRIAYYYWGYTASWYGEPYTVGDLYYISCSDSACSSRSTNSIDTDNDVGHFSNLEMDSSDNPVIGYYHFTNNELRLDATAAYSGSGSSVTFDAGASDTSNGGDGVQAGDEVVLTFSGGTNCSVDSNNIDSVLLLSDNHSWLDGSGNIGSAVWSNTTNTCDTLTVTLSDTGGSPTITDTDTICLDGTVITDTGGLGIFECTDIAGSFGSPLSGMAIYLRLNENGIDPTPGDGYDVYDSTGNNNHGLLGATGESTEAGDPTWAAGMSGSALSFDGTDDYVYVADNDTLDITGELTIEAWVYLSAIPSSSGWYDIAAKGDNSGRVNYMVGLIKDTTNCGTTTLCLGFDFIDTGGNWRGSASWSAKVSAGAWTHVAVVYDDDNDYIKFYKDGVLQETITNNYTLTINGFALAVGRAGTASSGYFSGSIDEVVIYNRVLSGPEIQNRYNIISVPEITVSPNTVDFGSMGRGAQSNIIVTVSNTGGAALNIGAIASADPLAAPFSMVTDNCSNLALAGGANCTLTVRFAPTAIGAFSDGFDVPSDDADEPTVTVNVSGTGVNAPPDGTIDTPVGSQTINQGGIVNFTGTGIDPDGDTPLTYLWAFDGGAADSTLEDPGNVTFNTAGTYNVTFTVTDSLGASDPTPAAVTITVNDITDPTISITSPTSSPTYNTVSGTISIGGTASDNVSVIDVTWVNDRGGSGTASGTTNWTVAGITLQIGDNVITVTALDAAGNTGQDTLTVTYHNSPDGTIDTPTGDQTIIQGGSLNFTGTGTDPDGDTPLTYLWAFDGGAADSTLEDPGNVTFNTPGTYNVTFTVTDSRGAPDPTPAAVTIRVLYPGEIIPDASTIALYHLNETAMDQAPGGTDAEDTSGNNNHGTAEASMDDTDWVPGKYGNALDFDGVDDYVDLNAALLSTSNGLQPYTIEAWVQTQATGGGWLGGGWQYRRPISITGSIADQTDYQVQVTLTTSEMGNPYANVNSDGSDIRFTASDGITGFSYWIESWNNTGTSNIWVKADSIPAAGTTIYMYYGNSGAVSSSDGAATFDLFDDFDSFDGTKWGTTGAYSVTSGQLNITTGSVYSNNTIASQPGFTSEARVQWNNFADYSGLNIADAQSTQSGNGGSNKLVYLMADNSGSTTTLNPTADVSSQSGDCTSATVRVSQWNHVYMRFDLSSITYPVQSATLRLYSSASAPMRVFDSPTDDWSECGSASDGSNQIGSDSSTTGGWYEIDVTSYVVTKAGGGMTFMIRNDSGGWQPISSRQSSNPPELVISSGGRSINAWAADGMSASYNISGGGTQFTATAGAGYTIGHSISSSQVTYYQDRTVTNSYTGTWSGPFYLWLGYLTGSAAGTADITDMSVDWVLVRKYASPEPGAGVPGTEETGQYFGILSQYTSGTSNRFGLIIQNGQLKYTKDGSDIAVSSSSNLNDGSWYHVAATKDSSGNVQLYVDGVPDGSSGTDTTAFENTKTLIGAYDPSVSHFRGRVDEVVIYDRALTPVEIASHAGTNADISVSPNPALFGSVTTGTTSDIVVTVSNIGGLSLNIGSVAVADPIAAPFSIVTDNCSNQAVQGGANCAITVRFAPAAAGPFSDSFDIPSDDPDEPTVTVNVSGTGVTPVPEIDVTDSIAPTNDLLMGFGAVLVGSSSSVETVTISNIGTMDLNVSNIQKSGTDAGEFTLDLNGGASPCGSVFPVVVNIGNYCTVTVSFSPTTTGSKSAPLDISSDDMDEPMVSVTLSGTGITNIPPDGTIDTPATNQTIAVGGSVNFTGTGTDPDNNTPFIYLWDFGGGAANSTLEDPGNVTFNAAGTYNVTFTVTDSLGASDPTPATVTITVNNPPDGVIDTPAGDQTITEGQSVNFTGTGTDPDNNTPFTYLWDFNGGAANSTLEDPGNVTFNTAGTYNVTFTVTDSLGTSDPTPAGVAITVNAHEIDVTDTIVPTNDLFMGFGNVLVGSGSSVETVTISNIGTAALSVSNIQKTGTDAGEFTLDLNGGTTPCGSVFPVAISAGNNCTVTVTFSPTTSGAKSALLDITSDDNDEPTVSVGLSGTGITNSPPDGTIDTPIGDQTIAVGGSVNFTGTGTDPDNNTPLTYRWDFGGGAAPSILEDPGNVTFNTAGTYNVTFTVTDNLGAPDPTPATVTITVNNPPNGVIDTPIGNQTITEGQSVNFTGTGTDPDNNTPFTYLWDFNGGAANSTLEDPGNVTFNTAGTYNVTFTVTDSLGTSDPTPAAVTITVNSACVPTITKDATTSAYFPNDGNAAKSWSHTVGSGNNRILVVLSGHSGAAFSSVTYGSQSLTLIDVQDRGGDKKAEMWYLINPNVGTYTITVTGATNSYGVYGAHSFFGVDQTNPIGASAKTTIYSSGGSTMSVNLPSAPNEVAVDIADSFWSSPNTITVGAGQTEEWNLSGGCCLITGSSTEPGAASVTMSWGVTSNSNALMVAATLKPTSCP